MYQAFYGLNEAPFSIAPNPKYLFLSAQHQQAITHLQYCLQEGGGFVLLTGEVGTGKTTLARSLLAQLPSDNNIASILNPTLSETELLATLCDELAITYPESPSLKQLTDVISQFLLDNHRAGRSTLLVIDEAQHLRSEVLEQLRLLTNLETDHKKLLQVVLIGQPELQQLLRQQHLRQLAQRITARYHLTPLSHADVSAYIAHRLHIAGRDSALFSKSACNVIHRLSGGIPRIINLICDKSLLSAYGAQLTQIDKKTVLAIAPEILVVDEIASTPRPWLMPLISSVAAFFIGFSLMAWQGTQPVVQAKPVVEPLELPSQDKINIDLQIKPLLQGATLRQTAFSGLMGLWGTAQGAGNKPCQSALTYGLRCFSGQGWAELVEYNHPAVISINYQGAIYHGVVVSVDSAEQVSLIVNRSQFSVPKQWLLEHLSGGFTLLWQPPSDFGNAVKLGSNGLAVSTLSRQLNEYYQISDPVTSHFDEPLSQQVKRFQGEHQLVVDGIVGAKTLLKLQVATKQQGKMLQGEI